MGLSKKIGIGLASIVVPYIISLGLTIGFHPYRNAADDVRKNIQERSKLELELNRQESALKKYSQFMLPEGMSLMRQGRYDIQVQIANLNEENKRSLEQLDIANRRAGMPWTYLTDRI